jgi:hopanoid biosynthesis associated protein HpnK
MVDSRLQRAERLPPRLIVNADDFGSSATVNAAVMQAHQEGVLTSTSLMVAGDAMEEAVALARTTPTLAVGLHLVVVDGPAVLPPAEIPHLLDGTGCFPSSPVRVGLRYAFDRTAREELAREMTAQFAHFAATGLPLSHVDGHLHMHMHPVVFDRLLPLAQQYGAAGIRFPRDELWLALRHNHHHFGIKLVWAIAFALLTRRNASRLACCALFATQRVYGLMQSGHMDEAYLLKVLARIHVPSTEIYFHPDMQPANDGLGPNRGDLGTLISPAVAQVIRERGLCLTTYPNLAMSEDT